MEIEQPDGKTFHRIVFEDRNGIRHSLTNSEVFVCEPGQKVPLIFMPDNPERVRLNWFGRMWGLSIMLAGLGLKTLWYFVVFKIFTACLGVLTPNGIGAVQ